MAVNLTPTERQALVEAIDVVRGNTDEEARRAVAVTVGGWAALDDLREKLLHG